MSEAERILYCFVIPARGILFPVSYFLLSLYGQFEREAYEHETTMVRRINIECWAKRCPDNITETEIYNL